MAILIFQHEPHAGPGRIAGVLRDLGFKLDVRRLDLVRSETPGKTAGSPLPEAQRGGIPADYDNVEGIVSLGGTMNVTGGLGLGGSGSGGSGNGTTRAAWMDREIEYLRGAHERQLPVIGVCLGCQMLATALGGTVGPAPAAEYGLSRVTLSLPGQTDTIFAGVPWTHRQAQSHAQMVTQTPPGAAVLAASDACKVQAFRLGLRSYGFQFHLEADRAILPELLRDVPAGAMDAEAANIEKHYDAFDRVATRICQNIATYVFPLQRRLSA